jgi:hypothetical protein
MQHELLKGRNSNVEISRLTQFGKPNECQSCIDPTTPPSSSVLGTSIMPVRPHVFNQKLVISLQYSSLFCHFHLNVASKHSGSSITIPHCIMRRAAFQPFKCKPLNAYDPTVSFPISPPLSTSSSTIRQPTCFRACLATI